MREEGYPHWSASGNDKVKIKTYKSEKALGILWDSLKIVNS